MLSLYLAVLDDQSKEEQFIDVYNTYKRLVYHTAYKIMGDSYLAEDVLQEVFLYVAKNFSKIHRENCHELAAYLVSCSRSRAYDMLRKQREEPLEEIPDVPDDAPVPDDAVVSTDNIQHLTELIGQMKPMYRDPLRLLAMGYTNREIAESLGLTDEVVRILMRKLNVLSVSDMMRNRAVFLSPSVSSCNSSYIVKSRNSWMSNGASLAPQEMRMDFAVLPETKGQQ